jgi:hypothetical protein
MKKFRIITNNYFNFDVQERFLLFFWRNLTTTDFDNLKDAENWLKDIKLQRKKYKLAKKNFKKNKYLL